MSCPLSSPREQTNVCSLTTYSDVKLSYPKMDDPPPYAQTPSEIAAWQESYFNAHKGIFHSINFHRIVLDESQETKSDKTLGAVACTAVKAKHKWCMSGTPVLNSGLEFYSYMVFFGLAGRDKESKKAWRKEYGKQTDDRCSKRLQEEVTKWTLRRTHADSFIGSKLVTLPEAQQGIIPVYMNPVEHAVYRTVFHRFVERTRDLRDMTEEERKNNQDLSATQFTCALALLLRLRQITAHPLLVQDCMQSLLEPGDFTMLRNKLAAMQLDTRTEQDTRKHLQMMLQHAGDLPALDYEDSSNDEASSTPARESAFGSTDDFNAILDDTEQRGSVQNLARVGCPTCGKLQKNPMLTKCGHTYCNACVFEMYFVGRGNGKLQPDCIACGACISLSELTPYSQDYAPLVTAVKPSKDDRKKYQKSRAKIIIDTIASWVTGTGEVLHSSKTTAVAGKMLDILTETPDAKIICYTQFKPV